MTRAARVAKGCLTTLLCAVAVQALSVRAEGPSAPSDSGPGLKATLGEPIQIPVPSGPSPQPPPSQPSEQPTDNATDRQPPGSQTARPPEQPPTGKPNGVSPPLVTRTIGTQVTTITDTGSAPVPDTTLTTSVTSTAAATGLTTVVQVFYLRIRARDGTPYEQYHHDSGSVLAADESLTTLVITRSVDAIPHTQGWRTRSGHHGPPDATITTAPSVPAGPAGQARDQATPPLPPPPSLLPPPAPTSPATGTNGTTTRSWPPRGGPRSHNIGTVTVTQGPSTFIYTGKSSPSRAVENRCSLNGTTSAACLLTFIGEEWYKSTPGWDGSLRTLPYNWTVGKPFGFAPVTLTAGVEKLPKATAGGAKGNENAAARGVWSWWAGGLVGVVAVALG